MRVAAMDLGIHNTAIAIEEFEKTNITGSSRDEIIDSAYMEGKLVFIDKVDFAPDKKGTKITNAVLNNVTNYLESLIPELEKCDVVLIEKQFKTKGVQNATCIHLEHHIQAILLYLLKDTNCKVESYASKFKTKVFEESKMTKPQRKKWTVEQAGNLLLAREDYENCEIFNNKKKDDYADVIMMIQSYKVKLKKSVKVKNTKSNKKMLENDD